jgi:ligand-binding sensor domain-containing protein
MHTHSSARTALLWAFLLLTLASTGQADIDIEHVITRDGPARGTINTIVQDRFGYLWLGTTNGLLRFDGYTFESYRHDPADSTTWLRGCCDRVSTP